MRKTCVLSIGVMVSFLLGLASSPPAHAGFNVGAQLSAISLTPACTQGDTSLAIVQGSKLAGIDPSAYPVLLVVTCVDDPFKLKFVDPATGNVLTTITTPAVSGSWKHLVNRPDKGNLLGCAGDGSIYSIVYSQFDKTQVVTDPVIPPTLGTTSGSLPKSTTYAVRYTYATANGETLPSNRQTLSTGGGGGTIGITVTAPALPSGANGIGVYISSCSTKNCVPPAETKQGTSSPNTNTYTQTNLLVAGASLPSANTTGNTTGTPGTITPVARPANLPTNCAGLAWDAEEDTIYQGYTTGSSAIAVRSFKAQTNPTVLATYDVGSAQCTPTGLAVAGGVLLVTCSEANPSTTKILRMNKATGAVLSPDDTVTPTGLTVSGLRGLACDPVSFQLDASTPPKDLFKDAMWSRSPNGNTLVALEFPAFTCGLPSNATVLTPGLASPFCFDGTGVTDLNRDGLPDCWENGALWSDGKPGIDFDGDGNRDLQLCVMVDPDGGGTADTEECADTTFKHLFVEIDYMDHHRPNPLALSQPQPVDKVTSVVEAFKAAPVSPGIKIHFQVDEQLPHSDYLVFTPCTGPAAFSPDASSTADFDDIKKSYFGTVDDRASANRLNAKRLAFRYMVFAHKQVGPTPPTSGSNSSGCSEVAGDDAAITLGGFTSTTETENGLSVTHNRGSRDEQAATVMHELGHNLGRRHGGHENVNCKPNYLSVMKYSGQFPGMPIPAADWKLDYSRAQLPDLDKGALNESVGLGNPVSFPSLVGEKTSFGPSSWTVVAADAYLSGINWNKSGTPTEPSVSADINAGPTQGCDAGTPPVLEGSDDWQNLVYRFSAALDFAGGGHPTANEHVDIDPDQANEFFQAADLDGNNVGDASDCGTFSVGGTPQFPCTHRIDIKPSSVADPSGAKIISLGASPVVSIAIFSELCTTSTPPIAQCPTQPTLGNGLWDATLQVVISGDSTKLPVFHVDSMVIPMQVNANGNGTCSTRDMPDPVTGKKDGKKDLICGFDTSGIPLGTYTGYVTGFFTDPNVIDPVTGLPAKKGFQAKQNFIIVP